MQINQYSFDLYILSAFNTSKTIQENEDSHEALKAQLQLQGITFADCEGAYHGVKERSVIAEGARKMVIHHYATQYGQECFLHLLPHRGNMYKAFLVSTETGGETFTGYFRSVPSVLVQAHGLDYTKDRSGNYFTIVDTDGSLEDYEERLSEELLAKMERGGK